LPVNGTLLGNKGFPNRNPLASGASSALAALPRLSQPLLAHLRTPPHINPSLFPTSTAAFSSPFPPNSPTHLHQLALAITSSWPYHDTRPGAVTRVAPPISPPTTRPTLRFALTPREAPSFSTSGVRIHLVLSTILI
jgi:hypothetical protein